MSEGNHFMSTILSCITTMTYSTFYTFIPFERVIVRKNDIVMSCCVMTGLFYLSCYFFIDDIQIRENEQQLTFFKVK